MAWILVPARQSAVVSDCRSSGMPGQAVAQLSCTLVWTLCALSRLTIHAAIQKASAISSPLLWAWWGFTWPLSITNKTSLSSVIVIWWTLQYMFFQKEPTTCVFCKPEGTYTKAGRNTEDKLCTRSNFDWSHSCYNSMCALQHSSTLL